MIENSNYQIVTEKDDEQTTLHKKSMDDTTSGNHESSEEEEEHHLQEEQIPAEGCLSTDVEEVRGTITKSISHDTTELLLNHTREQSERFYQANIVCFNGESVEFEVHPKSPPMATSTATATATKVSILVDITPNH